MTPRRKRPELNLDTWQLVFDAAVERLQNSPNREERESLFAGMSVFGDHPVLFARSLLLQHAHFLGDPGSNKTSKGLAPLMTQLIASATASVCVLDLKGDMALFHGARIEAERAGLSFKVFTNRVG